MEELLIAVIKKEAAPRHVVMYMFFLSLVDVSIHILLFKDFVILTLLIVYFHLIWFSFLLQEFDQMLSCEPPTETKYQLRRTSSASF